MSIFWEYESKVQVLNLVLVVVDSSLSTEANVLPLILAKGWTFYSFQLKQKLAGAAL